MLRLLVIEDDQRLSDNVVEVTKEFLQSTQAFDGAEGLYYGEQNIYDVIVLDLMMPEMNGYQVLQQLRKRHIETPVLMLTAKDGIDDKIKGFQVGADDYLVKPFHREELLMRLKALLKRTHSGFQENQISHQNLVLNIQQKTAKVGKENVPLNGKEYDLLEYFIQNPEMIITKEQIFDRIWGFDSETSITVVEVYMSNLRKKLKNYHDQIRIKTLRNVGYMLTKGEQN
ncbi:DNA-binding response regulator [Carnobacterium divergens]|uniref:Response regulator transcription factor n=1 Tax=Carnobacterium divergens TaxID=2748 RepID=A0AAW8R7R0_CARDV|nr:response regulator transcription factor [Carnobacterium divergens]AOA00174.1 DNA-binding response regulator [Carnobacterium divergens]MDT1957536.1 response regulator transcription factor [Carnobacterium divergens]MDT1973739.1 response regulator transcription factor [Carnobacterium divergens]MDT1996522.1 response regulator transcription factor [Carnobacterium divergens]TFI62857.1 DNA-binding response regulator [Carnobacterium divergens]